MVIGFDAKRAFLNNTGLGNYSRTLIQSLCAGFSDAHFYAFTPKVNQNLYYEQMVQYENLEIITAPKYMPNSVWRSWGIVNTIREKHLDVYHGLSNELPINAKRMSCKKVVTIHDLIFESHPELYPPIDKSIYHYKFKQACTQADTIIAISEFTKKEIVNRYNVAAEKVKVLYQDAASIYKQTYTQQQLLFIKNKYQLPDRFLLQVGTIEKRKNAKATVEALLQLDNSITLVLVGRPTPYLKEIEALIAAHELQRRVMILSNVSYMDLPLVYQQAVGFIYGSRIEGFGIPILEAIYSGLPVIAASGTCLEEAGGPESLYFQPDDIVTLAQHMQEVWTGDFVPNPERTKLHLQQFDHDNIAEKVMQIYQS